jgi:serine/threonine-protein kinase HipA
VGIAAACAWRERLGGHDCFVVERFDRERRDDGSVAGLHQEDLCQALGVLPEAKYEAEGGPSVRATVELIRAVAGSRVAREILAFLDQVVVGFVLGDGDRHGKNVGLLHDAPGSVRLAPAYDLVSTAVYPELTRRLAMAIGGEDDPDRIDRDAWSRLAAECGLGSGLPKRVAALAVRVVGAVRSVRAEAEDEGWAEPVLDEILAIAETRAATVA